MSDPGIELRRIAMAMRESRALYAAAQLGLADLIADGTTDAVPLAAATGTDPSALRRLLRALVALGVFSEDGPGRFALTAMGERLRSDHPQSFRAGALFLAGDLRWQLWGGLLDSLRTAAPAADQVLGQTIFDHYATHPQDGLIAHQAMSTLTGLLASAVLAAYDFSPFRTIVDIGGGTGSMIAAILHHYPALHGILFDLPHVSAGARAKLAACGLAGRCRFEAGNFFDGIPEDADAHLLKQVIHDWDDSQAVRLLTRCRQALPPAGTLLIVERVLPEQAMPGQATDAYLLDLEMLIGSGGRERTAAEYRALLSAAGFEQFRVVPTRATVSIIEAKAP